MLLLPPLSIDHDEPQKGDRSQARHGNPHGNPCGGATTTTGALTLVSAGTIANGGGGGGCCCDDAFEVARAVLKLLHGCGEPCISHHRRDRVELGGEVRLGEIAAAVLAHQCRDRVHGDA